MVNKDKLPIIAFTSYPDRFEYCISMIQSLVFNTMETYKICMTVYKDDLQYLPEELQMYIDNNIIELIVAEEDLKCHLKYFYVMQKYKDYPIILVDDDIIYSIDMIISLYNAYKQYPFNCIFARKVLYKKFDNINNLLLPHKEWEKNCIYIDYPSFDIMPQVNAGVLYPPNALDINDSYIPSIKQCLYNSDIYLYYLSLKNLIPTKYVSNYENELTYIDGSQSVALSLSKNYENNKNNEFDKTIKMFLTKNIKI